MSIELITWLIGSALSLGVLGYIWRLIAKRDARIRKEGVDRVVTAVNKKSKAAKARMDKIQAERRDEKQTMERLDDGTF